VPARDGPDPCGDDTPLELAQRVQVRAGLVEIRAGKLRPRVTFHELRYTAASLMLTVGVSPVVVARQLGHASSAITTSVYEHLLDDGLLDEAVSSVHVAGSVAGTIELHPKRPRIAHTMRVRRGAGADERGGLENRWPPRGGPWVRIPPPPLD
jgi:hypothetical protein